MADAQKAFDDARGLLDDLESRWISLFEWVASVSGRSAEELIGELGDRGTTILGNYQKRRKQEPRGGFTPFHFLQFPDYVDLAAKLDGHLATLGKLPIGWVPRLRQQNEQAVTFRNDLQHGRRFLTITPESSQSAIAIFREQLNDLAAWWPALPVTTHMLVQESDPFRRALGIIGHDERSFADLAEQLGFTPFARPTNEVAPGRNLQFSEALHGSVDRLYRVGRQTLSGGPNSVGLYVAYLNEWPKRSAARAKQRRRIAKALTEQQSLDGRFLIIMLDDRLGTGDRRDTEIEIVYPRLQQNSTVRVVIQPAEPTRHHLELLRELNIGGLSSLAAITNRWNSAFNTERVTNDFYNEFRDLRDQIAVSLIEQNPDHPVLRRWTAADFTAKKPSPEQREFQLNLTSFATRQLSRLLFLWFLQHKGWLGARDIPGPQAYLLDLFEQNRKQGLNFFADILVPIDFDGLGAPANDAKHLALEERFGSLPYLNGGLFRADADEYERKLFGVDEEGTRTLAVALPNDLFDPRQDEFEHPTRQSGRNRKRTILGMLRSYRFTTQESSPDDQSVDPDPELLGKVFENLYQADERHESGSYYTPREIVHYMCRQALDGYVRDRTGLDQGTLDALRAEAIDWEATDFRLTPAQEGALDGALEDVTIVDPAVGSGAFLVGMLQEIVLLRRGARSAATDREVDPGSDQVFGWKRHAITHNLYGVDINPTAVEICRLRLWLSLVIEHDITRIGDIHPLPNLEFRVVAGNSLIDRMGAAPFVDSLGTKGKGISRSLELQPHYAKLDNLRLQFAAADEKSQKRSNRIRVLADGIRKEQFAIATIQLNEEIARSRNERNNLAALPKAKSRVTKLSRRIEGLEAMRDGLHLDAPFLQPLLWPVSFPEIFAPEIEPRGFDIVVANPPYVRQESIDAIDQESFQAAFADVYAGTADLFVFFFSRAVQLLKEGGWMSFVTSNKYMRANYGEKLRRELPKQVQITQVIDFGDLDIFEKIAAYPAIVVGKKTREPDLDAAVTVADLAVPIRKQLKDDARTANASAVRNALQDLPGIIEGNHPANYPQALLRGKGWILEDPVLVRLFDRLMNEGPPLGEYVDGRIYYGIKTGFNEAFVIDQATRDRLVAADPRSAEVIKPWLRGRDIKRWKAEWAGLHLIAIQNSGDRDANNPWANASSEAAARKVFADTFPAIHEHLSAFEEKLRPRADQGKYWWELRACAYYAEFDAPKIFWPENSSPSNCNFAYVAEPMLSNNKAYIIANGSIPLCFYLNSPISLWIFDKLATKLRGGWMEMRARSVVERMPIPATVESFPSIPLSDREVHAVTSGAFQLSAEERDSIWSWFEGRQSYSSDYDPNLSGSDDE